MMRPNLTALVSLAVLLPCAPLAAQPVNDFCTDATFISLTAGGDYIRTGTTAASTGDLTDSGCSDADSRDVWFRIITPRTGSYSFDLFGSGFDTTLSIWQGDCAFFSPGTALACNDDEDFGILTSFIPNLPIDAGTAIFIRISGFQNAFGAYQLTVSVPSGSSVTGACCVGALCAVQQAGTCSGTFVGIGAPCSPTLCVPADAGICCIGTVCFTDRTSTTCVPPTPGVGAEFFLGGTACNVVGDARTPCCYADFDKSGFISPSDIFDFLNAWFSSSPFAKVGGDGVSPPVVSDIFDFLNAWFVGDC